jgi:hypothetical protein
MFPFTIIFNKECKYMFGENLKNKTIELKLRPYTVEQKVKRLQMRIAPAATEGKYRKMRSLQWLLAHSRFAKLLAIRRVTSNNGSRGESRRTVGIRSEGETPPPERK